MKNFLSYLICKVLYLKYSKFRVSSSNPIEQQNKLFKKMKRRLKGTEIYTDLGLEFISGYVEFCQKIPTQSYSFYYPYVKKILNGEKNILFKDQVVFFASTTGSTATSLDYEGKRIPYNKELVRSFKNFYAKLAGMVIKEDNEYGFLNKKGLVYGNLHPLKKVNKIGVPEGYISGFLTTKINKENKNKFPSKKTLEIIDWNTKSDKIIEECKSQDIRFLNGTPIYIVYILEKLLDKTGAQKVIDVWPNIQTMIYGGTSIESFKDRIDKLCGKKLNYYAGYVATEAALGITSSKNHETYILNTDEVLYSFTSFQNDKIYDISNIKLNDVYKLNISSPNGFLQYETGDLLQLIDDKKEKVFKILGRDSTVMSFAGEKLSEDQSNSALLDSSKQAGSLLTHYFLYPEQTSQGKPCYGFCLFLNGKYKENLVENFTFYIDENLGKYSSFYNFFRHEDKVLEVPIVHIYSDVLIDNYFLKYSNKGQLKLKKFFSSKKEMEELLSQIKQ